MIIITLSIAYIVLGFSIGSLVHYYDPFDSRSSDDLFVFCLSSILWPVTLILWAFKLPVFLISLWVSKINKIKRDKQRALEEIRSAKLLAERARQEAEEEEAMRIELVEERARAKENKRRRLARKAKKEAEARAKAIIVSKTIKTKTTKLAKETLVKKLDSMD